VQPPFFHTVAVPQPPFWRCYQMITRRRTYKSDLCPQIGFHSTPNMQTFKENTYTSDKLTTNSLTCLDDKASLASTIKPLSPPKKGAKSAAKDTKESPKWYNRFSTQPEKPGEETWRDASLPDKERWKQWQKAKDREQARGYVPSIRYIVKRC